MSAKSQQSGNPDLLWQMLEEGVKRVNKRAWWNGYLTQCQRPTRGFVPGEDPEDTPFPMPLGMCGEMGTRITTNLVVASSASHKCMVEDAVTELGSLIAMGIMGHWINRDQMAALDGHKPRGHNYHNEQHVEGRDKGPWSTEHGVPRDKVDRQSARELLIIYNQRNKNWRTGG